MRQAFDVIFKEIDNCNKSFSEFKGVDWSFYCSLYNKVRAENDGEHDVEAAEFPENEEEADEEAQEESQDHQKVLNKKRQKRAQAQQKGISNLYSQNFLKNLLKLLEIFTSV